MGNYRQKPLTVKHTQANKHGSISYAVSSMCGWRKFMEDAHVYSSPINLQRLSSKIKNKKNNQSISLFAIFDGHGGPQVAIFVSRHFQEQLSKSQAFQKGQYEAALKNTFFKMDELLRSQQGKKEIQSIHIQEKQKQNTSQERNQSGCTANVILITPQVIYCANAGDARSIASINNNTEIFIFSQDHKPEKQSQANRIKQAGGKISQNGRVNGVLNVTRSIGDLQHKDQSISPEKQVITSMPDIIKFKKKGQIKIDFIIMGCDGIWQVLTNQEMIIYLRKEIQQFASQITSQQQSNHQYLSKIVQGLLDKNLAQNSQGIHGKDNMSAILIKFDEIQQKQHKSQISQVRVSSNKQRSQIHSENNYKSKQRQKSSFQVKQEDPICCKQYCIIM